MKLAILETDTPVDPVYNKYGRYGLIFEDMLRLAGLPEAWECEYYNVIDKHYPSTEPDAYLITGSKHNCYDNDEWIVKLVEYVASRPNKKFIGVCYGHQIIARALGARTGLSSAGWEISATPIQLTAEGEKVLGASESVTIMQMHRDVVHELPAGCQLLASTDKCAIQGFYKQGHYWCVQGHPEYTPDMIKLIVQLRLEKGLFDPDMAQDALARADTIPADASLLAKCMVKFLTN